jgi:2-dehydro-3-deoxyglucarate aldolase/4-hydroxy-2-oxoheptanedioate aldolase
LAISISRYPWGIPGQFTHPDFVKAVEYIVDRCKSHSVPVAIIVSDPEQALDRIRQEFCCLSYWADIWLFQRALAEGIQAIRAGLSQVNVR